jgi:hypothetical protein
MQGVRRGPAPTSLWPVFVVTLVLLLMIVLAALFAAV